MSVGERLDVHGIDYAIICRAQQQLPAPPEHRVAIVYTGSLMHFFVDDEYLTTVIDCDLAISPGPLRDIVAAWEALATRKGWNT